MNELYQTMKTLLLFAIILALFAAFAAPPIVSGPFVTNSVPRRPRTIPLPSTNGAPAKVQEDVRRLQKPTITHTTNSTAFKRKNK